MTRDLFAPVTSVSPNDLLRETLAYNAPLALSIATGKACSEMLISPILTEARRMRGESVKGMGLRRCRYQNPRKHTGD